MSVFYVLTTGEDTERQILQFYCRDDYGVMDAVGIPMLGSACKLLEEYIEPFIRVVSRTTEIKGAPQLREVEAVNDIHGDDTGSRVYLAVNIEMSATDFADADSMVQHYKDMLTASWSSFCRRHPFLNGALVRNTGLVRRLTSIGDENTNNL